STSTARPSVAQCSIWAVAERCVPWASCLAKASSRSETLTGDAIYYSFPSVAVHYRLGSRLLPTPFTINDLRNQAWITSPNRAPNQVFTSLLAGEFGVVRLQALTTRRRRPGPQPGKHGHGTGPPPERVQHRRRRPAAVAATAGSQVVDDGQAPHRGTTAHAG